MSDTITVSIAAAPVAVEIAAAPVAVNIAAAPVAVSIAAAPVAVSIAAAPIAVSISGARGPAGNATLAPILTALGISSYATLALANAGEGEIGKPFYDTTLETLRTTTDIT